MSPRVLYCCDDSKKTYEDYYTTQVGNGMPVFMGASVQRGHGIGSLFGALAKSVVPLLKTGGKVLGKQALRSGVKLVGDLMSGQRPQKVVKRRGMEFLKSTVNQLISPPGERIKKKHRRPESSRSKRSRKATSKDIFQ